MELERWLEIDKELLLAFNGSGSVFVNEFALTVTNGFTWLPLYIILLYLVIKNNEKLAQILLIVISVGFCVLLSGGVSDIIVKPYLARLRPVADPELKGMVEIIKGYVPNNFSFFSSHAANTASVAVFFCLLVKNRLFSLFMLGWSLINCWSRLYLAAHYPSDIIVGLLYGIIIGVIVYLSYMRLYTKISPKLHYISSQYTKTGYSLPDIDYVLNIIAFIMIYVIIKSVITAL